MSHPKLHKPTPESRAKVEALTSFGVTQQDIANYMDIDDMTLKNHYEIELRTAAINANEKVAKRLYAKAVEQDELQAQIFWMKTRGRWRSADSEKEDKPIQLTITHEELLKSLK